LHRRGVLPACAFLLPVIVMLTVYIVMGISPFGDQAAMIIDSYHQYVPFFSEFHYKIWHGESLLYSWHGSLGYNFWSVQAYYLASPLNFIIAIFPETMMIEAFQTLIVLKIGLCGLTAYYYLRVHTGRNDYTTVIFAAFYALGGFMLAYNWNVMWLDCVALLPLIVRGAEKLILEKDGRQYTITLGLAVFCNYYIAIMICVFLVLYFFVCWFSQPGRKKTPKTPAAAPAEVSAAEGAAESGGDDLASALIGGEAGPERAAAVQPEEKNEVLNAEAAPAEQAEAVLPAGGSGRRTEIFRRGLHFALCSLLACGLAAIYLLPTYFTMINSSIGYKPDHWELYQSFFDMFKQQFAMIEPTELTGAPNLYCGVGIFIMAVMYAAARQIPVRERILKISLAAFIFISLNVNVLNYIWHGFHFPNNLPGRYSFIYIFLMVVMAYDAYQSIRLTKEAVCYLLTAGILLLYVLTMIFAGEAPTLIAKIVTGILIALYLIVLYAHRTGFGRSRVRPQQLLALIMLAELFANSIFAIYANGSVTESSYMAKTAGMAQIRDEYSPGNDTFYRMETAQILGRDDIIRYNMNGLSFFSSTCDDKMEELIGSLGFYNAGNKYSYKGATPLTDAMLGIRYVISDEALPAQNLQLADKKDDLMLYENVQDLSVGYMVDPDILSWNIIDGEPFTIQNDFARLAAGSDKNIFNLMSVPDPEISSGDITSTEENTWDYDSYYNAGKLTYKLTFDNTADVYLYFEATHCTDLKVIRGDDEETYTDERGHIVHLGTCHEGDEVTLEFTMDDEYANGSVVLQMASYDADAFASAYEKLSQSQLNVTSSSSTSLAGTIDAKEKGTMMLSVPYDEGWSIKVDGQKVKQFRIGEGLTGISMDAGSHTVEMNYTPQGFTAGLLISLASLAALWLLCGMPVPVRGRLRKQRL